MSRYPFPVYISLLFSSLFLHGCSPRHLDDFREESKGTIHALVLELQQVRTRDDLQPHASRLEKLFDELAFTMIEAQRFKEAHPHAEASAAFKRDSTASDQLRVELNRVLNLEGGREVIEKAQEAALNRLDAFEQTRK